MITYIKISECVPSAFTPSDSPCTICVVNKPRTEYYFYVDYISTYSMGDPDNRLVNAADRPPEVLRYTPFLNSVNRAIINTTGRTFSCVKRFKHSIHSPAIGY